MEVIHVSLMLFTCLCDRLGRLLKKKKKANFYRYILYRMKQGTLWVTSVESYVTLSFTCQYFASNQKMMYIGAGLHTILLESPTEEFLVSLFFVMRPSLHHPSFLIFILVHWILLLVCRHYSIYQFHKNYYIITITYVVQ